MNLRFDEKKNIGYIALSGLLNKTDILSAFDQVVADERYKKGMARLWDLRHADLSQLDSLTLTEMAQYSLKFPPGINDVKVAFVATGDLEYSRACLVMSASSGKPPMNVFRTVDEGERWLME